VSCRFHPLVREFQNNFIIRSKTYQKLCREKLLRFPLFINSCFSFWFPRSLLSSFFSLTHSFRNFSCEKSEKFELESIKICTSPSRHKGAVDLKSSLIEGRKFLASISACDLLTFLLNLLSFFLPFFLLRRNLIQTRISEKGRFIYSRWKFSSRHNWLFTFQILKYCMMTSCCLFYFWVEKNVKLQIHVF
jgi:hypothetical protein